MEKSYRNYKIDLLKFLFTLIVMLSHSRGIANQMPEIYQYAHWNVGGHLAVEFFFILTGYFMVVSYKKQEHNPSDSAADTKNYIVRKMKSFAPAYIVSFFILFFIKNLRYVILSGPNIIGDRVKLLFYSIPEILGIYMWGPLDLSYTYNEVTWYVSAMIFAMIPIFYLLCKNYKFTINIFAPIAGMVILGIRFNDPMGVADWSSFNGFVYKGVLRAFGDICLGMVLYELASAFKTKVFSTLTKVIFTIVEIAGWGIMFKQILFSPESNTTMFYILIIILAGLLTLSVSDVTYTGALFKSKFFRFLAPASLLLYLNHYTVRYFLNTVMADNNYWFNLFLYFILSIAVALVCNALVKGIKLLWRKMRHIFIFQCGNEV